MERTFAQVIEDHRVAIDADEVHVTLGPEATPETLAVELERVRGQLDAYAAIPEEVRLRARVEWLEALLGEIGELGQTHASEVFGEHPEVRALKRRIFRMTDMLPVDLEYAKAFHEAELGGVPGTKWAAIRRSEERKERREKETAERLARRTTDATQD